MRSQLRRALSVALLGVIAVLVVPAHTGAGAARGFERQSEQLTAIAPAVIVAPSLAPRLQPFDLGFIGVFIFTTFSISFASRARQRLWPRRLPRIRALGYGRRGPPLAPA